MRKTLFLFILISLVFAELNIQDNSVLYLPEKTYPISGTFDNSVQKIVINGTEISLLQNKEVKLQLFFEQYGKNLINLKIIQDNGVLAEKNYKILALRSFKDVSQKNIFAELAALGFVSGYVNNFVYPGEAVTREQAAGMVAKDMGLNPGAKSPTEVLAERGLFSDNKVKPEQKLTRAEAIALLCRMENIKINNPVGKTRFEDVTEKTWFYGYVLAAESRGWLNVFQDRFLMPDKSISRQEFVSIFTETYTVKEKLAELRDWNKGYLTGGAAQPKVVQRELISLSFENMDIQKVIKIIAQEADINIVSGPEVRGLVSGHFKNVYPEVALTNILKSLGYTYVLDGNLYRIERTKTAMAGRAYSRVREFKLNYADLDTVAKQIIKLVPGLENKIIISKDNNSIIISETHPQLKMAADIIKQLDTAPLQVMVEAKIFEVSAEESSRMGSKVIGNDHNNPAITSYESFNLNPNDKAIYVRSVDKDFQAYISALESRSDFNMLSSPKVIVINNREAVLETLDEVAYIDETVTYTNAGQTTSKKVIFKNVGTTLKFIPHINEKGSITIDLYPEISSAILDTNTNYPLTHQTKAHTSIVVQDGETFLLGGLLRDSKEKVLKKVPILGDIPLLGLLFRRTEEQTIKKDVMIMITPRIIEPANSPN